MAPTPGPPNLRRWARSPFGYIHPSGFESPWGPLLEHQANLKPMRPHDQQEAVRNITGHILSRVPGPPLSGLKPEE